MPYDKTFEAGELTQHTLFFLPSQSPPLSSHSSSPSTSTFSHSFIFLIPSSSHPILSVSPLIPSLSHTLPPTSSPPLSSLHPPTPCFLSPPSPLLHMALCHLFLFQCAINIHNDRIVHPCYNISHYEHDIMRHTERSSIPPVFILMMKETLNPIAATWGQLWNEVRYT